MRSQKRERCKELMKSPEIYLKRLPTIEDFKYYINNNWTNSDGLVKLRSSSKIHESWKFLINQARKPFLFVTSNRGFFCTWTQWKLLLLLRLLSSSIIYTIFHDLKVRLNCLYLCVYVVHTLSIALIQFRTFNPKCFKVNQFAST